ncbi:hypothetical protein EM858_26785 [Agrobacterium sp. CNPSo 2736]|nr:hypothetical protein EM858_26785 [Agrobacterium sp. CNPSo 2736]
MLLPNPSGTDALIARLRLEIEKLKREIHGSRPERKARLARLDHDRRARIGDLCKKLYPFIFPA